MLRVYLNILTPILPDEIPPQRRKNTTGPFSFKPYVNNVSYPDLLYSLCMLTIFTVQQPIIVPGDAHDVTALKGKIGICAERGIHIFDLEQYVSRMLLDKLDLQHSWFSLGAVETIIPNLSLAGDQAPMRLLQERIAKSRPLGLVKSGPEELLVVFNGAHRPADCCGRQESLIYFVMLIDVGCYITSAGEPARLCGYLRWETSATTYACRNGHLILFSPQFIEIRTIQTGKLVQVIEGEDIRMVHAGEDAVLVAMKKQKQLNGQRLEGAEDILMELVPTQEIETPQPLQTPELWDEWDM